MGRQPAMQRGHRDAGGVGSVPGRSDGVLPLHILLPSLFAQCLPALRSPPLLPCDVVRPQVLQQGEGERGGVQPGLHPHIPRLPAQGGPGAASAAAGRGGACRVRAVGSGRGAQRACRAGCCGGVDWAGASAPVVDGLGDSTPCSVQPAHNGGHDGASLGCRTAMESRSPTASAVQRPGHH